MGFSCRKLGWCSTDGTPKGSPECLAIEKGSLVGRLVHVPLVEPLKVLCRTLVWSVPLSVKGSLVGVSVAAVETVKGSVWNPSCLFHR